jgi:cytochrome c553
MNKPRRLLLILLIPAVVIAAALFLVAADNNKPFLPGVTVADEHPNGCVDCHKNQGEGRDYRMNVELAKVSGHPNIEKIVKKLPDDCMMCHKEGSKAGALNLITHKYHYRNAADNSFIKFYQGACLNCHSVDTATGKMAIKSGPKNW